MDDQCDKCSGTFDAKDVCKTLQHGWYCCANCEKELLLKYKPIDTMVKEMLTDFLEATGVSQHKSPEETSEIITKFLEVYKGKIKIRRAKAIKDYKERS